MNKFIILFFVLTLSLMGQAQNYYWVYFKDKANVKFDPYQYFDNKAIERRVNNGISLYDMSDFPLNQEYVKLVSDLSEEYIGETIWFNAVAVSASDEAIEFIRDMDFVKEVSLISSTMYPVNNESIEGKDFFNNVNNKDLKISEQLKKMQGEEFALSGINGKGLRIAVLDGGFPDVDKHIAFKHLRDNNQIIKTWNFPKKKEDVYGWNSHGTMVLSCIAGLNSDGSMIGLATGSEFLLARTETNLEEPIEEVWWLQAVEWADKNGADIINSSLGYTNQRHDISDMDGKTTLVTRAANMAASKGILVCNAAGNEGNSKNWMIMGAPADADSILSVGGLMMIGYRNTGFTSVGPTADGRLKPNVVAFGYAQAAKPDKNRYDIVAGTSFASPLVAGFAACAWQTRRDLSSMEMKSEIERSADHYPYFDYVYGYGVPQASYFINREKHQAETTFEFESDPDFIYVNIINKDGDMLFYHVENENGILDFYTQISLVPDSDANIKIEKTELYKNKILRVFYDGYMQEYKLNDNEIARIESDLPLNKNYNVTQFPHNTLLATDVTKQKQSNFGINSKYYIHIYFSFGHLVPLNKNDYSLKFILVDSYDIGLRYKYNFKKWYSLGGNFEFNMGRYRINNFPVGSFNSHINSLLPDGEYELNYERIDMNSLSLEIYQRFRVLVNGTFGMYIDTGIYGSWDYGNKFYRSINYNDVESLYKTKLNSEKLNWGVRARIGYGIISMYAKYRISDFYTQVHDIPKLTVGLELAIPIGGY